MKEINTTRDFLTVTSPIPYKHTGDNQWHGRDMQPEVAEIFYVFEGGIVLQINDASYFVPKNHLIVIPAHSTYSCWKMPGVPLNCISFYFKSEWNDEEFFSKFDLKNEITLIELPPKPIIQLYTSLRYFSLEPVPQRLCTCAQNAKLLLLIIAAKMRKEQTEQHFGDVLNYMQSHLSDPITLPLLAQFKEVCPAYFSRKFKEISGFSHSHYLKQLRMWHAASRLKAKKTLQEVAREVGFSNIYYFKSTFYAFFGIEPEKFADIFTMPSYVSVRKEESEE